LHRKIEAVQAKNVFKAFCPNRINGMKKILILFLLVKLAIPACTHAQAATSAGDGQTLETIVCIRHGEKPPGGLGQLNCRGLNRALALPDVLLKKYGAPQFIFAPNPTHKVDGNPGYYYVRPLMTIEPTAIRCGLPVNTEFGYDEIEGLENELNQPRYQNAMVFVAWEHGLLDRFAKNVVKHNGEDPKEVPIWNGNEYDMIFVFKITRENGQKKFSFTVDHEGLNGLSDKCPD
jgi:hypothetical protein